MTNPFSFLKQTISPSYLGVDIGTTSIKIAEVVQGEQLPKLVNYGILESKSSLARALPESAELEKPKTKTKETKRKKTATISIDWPVFRFFLEND